MPSRNSICSLSSLPVSDNTEVFIIVFNQKPDSIGELLYNHEIFKKERFFEIVQNAGFDLFFDNFLFKDYQNTDETIFESSQRILIFHKKIVDAFDFLVKDYQNTDEFNHQIALHLIVMMRDLGKQLQTYEILGSQFVTKSEYNLRKILLEKKKQLLDEIFKDVI